MEGPQYFNLSKPG